ncbi:MAG: hypothetical protein IH943_10120 [Acidobacteria bacterium]|nr:hypothetical protein [Acidobacteriota bacterium]
MSNDKGAWRIFLPRVDGRASENEYADVVAWNEALKSIDIAKATEAAMGADEQTPAPTPAPAAAAIEDTGDAPF